VSDGAPAPTCTVVICTRDRPEALDACLGAVAALTYPQFDVLVVDNAPRDGRTRAVAARRGTRYLVEPRPGLSRARNRGALASSSTVAAYLDDDAIPEPSWLDHLAAEFHDPRVMAVTGRILPTDVRVDSSRLRTWRTSLDGGAERRVVDRDAELWFELANFGGVGDGGSMAVRREAFDLWPGFHERLGRGTLIGGGEEHHAFFSLIDRGYRVVYAPDARVHHPYPSTAAEFRRRHLRDLAATSAYMTLLLVEEPRYRARTLRYIAEWALGRRRRWRANSIPAGDRIAPALRTALACAEGPALYGLACLARLRRLHRRPQGVPGAVAEILDSAR
jgi:GT2 family glycosyltransferase